MLSRSKVLVLLFLLCFTACVPPAAPAAPSAAPTQRLAVTPPPPQFDALPTRTALPAPAATAEPAASPGAVPALSGWVIDLAGNPVAGAQVSTDTAQGLTGEDGRFALAAQSHPQWVVVKHPDYLTRVRAAAPGQPVVFRITPDDGETVSLLFAGDAMFGRRFYDPNEDGDFSDGLLPLNPSVEDHLALMAGVRPLLENADLTFVNLETPISTSAAVDYTQQRAIGFHQAKDFVYASHPNAIPALKQAGVDILGISNNHLYDLLSIGVTDTLHTLQGAGFLPGAGYFGAGATEAEAWRPAVQQVGSQTIAFLACTTVTGIEHEITYVASDPEGKSGAAKCTEEHIQQEIVQARAAYDTVILMIHGGIEYQREPSPMLLKMTLAARAAGARLVINHHTHTIGGLDWNGSSLAAWSLGNFIFDQTIWSTLESGVLVVNLRRGEVVSAYMEPMMIEDYAPVGLTGKLADTVAREMVGRSSADFALVDGALESKLGFSTQSLVRTLSVDGGAAPGSIFALEAGEWVSGFQGEKMIRLGRDLLWVGDFEDWDVDTDTLESSFWELDPPYKAVGEAYAFQGAAGAHMQRGAQNLEAVFLTPIHRIPVEPGMELSITGSARPSANARFELQISWYPDTKGPSDRRLTQPVELPAGEAWQPFVLDVTVPENTVAIGVFFKLSPPVEGIAALDLDNLRLISWAAPGTANFSPLYNFYRVVGSGLVTLRSETFLRKP